MNEKWVMIMTDRYLNYLQGEHARLDAEIRAEERRRAPDQILIARLKKVKLGIKDQLAAYASGRSIVHAA
jgi:hypothetical protein